MSNADTLFRQWQMLRLIPRHPKRLPTQDLHRKLADAGFKTTDRTVARDLDALSSIFGFTCEEEGKAKLWFWPAESRLMDIPGMDPNQALAWMMSRGHLEKTLPTAAWSHLAPHFARAKEVLESHKGLKQGKWQRLFRVSERGPELQAPSMDTHIFDQLCTALVEHKCIQAKYLGRSTGESRNYTLNPLALVLKDGVYYLVATVGKYEDPVHFAVHRFESASVLGQNSTSPKGLDLDEYLARSFQYPSSSSKVKLRFRARQGVVQHLSERPLSADQKVNETSDENWERITATVLDTAELRWWLLGFGDQVVVEGPAKLRQEMGRIAHAMSKNYPEQA